MQAQGLDYVLIVTAGNNGNGTVWMTGWRGTTEALTLFKEGLLLTKDLSKRLDEIEKKVEILIKKEDGSVDKKPFLQEEP